jgi:hypothetical protein
MSISQFLALRVSGQGDRISGVLDQHPYLAVGVVVGVAVGDARSSGASAVVGWSSAPRHQPDT